MATKYLCGTCGSEDEELRQNGTVRKHHKLIVTGSGVRRSGEVCTGTGEPPEVVDDDGDLAAVGAVHG